MVLCFSTFITHSILVDWLIFLLHWINYAATRSPATKISGSLVLNCRWRRWLINSGVYGRDGLVNTMFGQIMKAIKEDSFLWDKMWVRKHMSEYLRARWNGAGVTKTGELVYIRKISISLCNSYQAFQSHDTGTLGTANTSLSMDLNYYVLLF